MGYPRSNIITIKNQVAARGVLISDDQAISLLDSYNGNVLRATQGIVEYINQLKKAQSQPVSEPVVQQQTSAPTVQQQTSAPTPTVVPGSSNNAVPIPYVDYIPLIPPPVTTSTNTPTPTVQQQTSAPVPAKESNNLLYWGLGILGVVGIGGTVIYLNSQKKSSKK